MFILLNLFSTHYFSTLLDPESDRVEEGVAFVALVLLNSLLTIRQ